MTADLAQTSATAQAELKVEKSIDSKAPAVVKIEPVDQVTVLVPQGQTDGDELEELQELCVKKEDADGPAKDDPVEEESCLKASPSRGIASATVAGGNPPPPKPAKGFTLAYQHAGMLLLNQVFFIVFPNIYVFDKHRIVCRVDSGNRYHAVDLTPNPPNPQSMFYIDDMPYWFDNTNRLWYNLDGQWYSETTYCDLVSARVEFNRYAEQNRLVTPNIAGPSSSVTMPASTLAASSLPDSKYDDEHLYPPLSLHPGQAEVDAWFEDFKSRRAALQRTRERLSDIKCPLAQCRKVQRRPQALRDHLYFHFGIKPYKCNYGCSNAFETEANKTRHLDSCAYRQYRR
ncbi:hypothetical protein FRC07_004268 [Ceratobasidium sp. 392]|nr:hypothetical protein FRC07_004268 [Ceratobasidium sp. 392]